jgi:hypothetical protein
VANAFRKTPQPLAKLQFILPDIATAGNLSENPPYFE